MGCTRCSQSPCACSQSFTRLKPGDYASTLVGSLQVAVDDVRDIFAQLGVRPYDVNLVWTRWSGGARGEGIEIVSRVDTLLPVPKIADLSELQLGSESIGTIEAGVIRVSEISARFTEDYLMGRGDGGEELPRDQSFSWEIAYQTVDGIGPRRRFAPVSAPAFIGDSVMWQVDLVRVSEDRTRAGIPG